MRAARFAVTSVMVLAFLSVSRPSHADMAALEKRLMALEEEVAVLKRQLEVEKEEKAAKAAATAVVTASAKDGFRIKAADDSFKLKIGTYVQEDARIFGDNKNTTKVDTFAARAVRLIFEGTVFDKYDFNISPEFGATSGTSTVYLADAYIDLKFFPFAKLKAGKFKAPFGLERLQSTPGSTFAEPSLATNLTPNRDIGFQLHGDLFKDRVAYAIGLFNGVQDNAGSGATTQADTNNDKEVNARIFTKPFKNTDQVALKGLGVGGAITYGHRKDSTNSNLPSYKTTAQTTFFSSSDLAGVSASGEQFRFTPQAYYYLKSFGIMGEYVSSSVRLIKSTTRDTFTNTGWQVGASYVLTGEDAAYGGVVPLKPFDPKLKQWGAFEVVARYAALDIDDLYFNNGWAVSTATPTSASAITTGFNWYLNKNIKIVFNYELTRYEDGATVGDKKSENLFLTRFQVSF